MRYLGLGLMILLLSACQTKDAEYYRVHPKDLQAALGACPEKSPPGVTCSELHEIATDVNQLAFALQQNQQEFGKQIIALQTELAALSKQAPNEALSTKMATIKQQLAMRLAIVTWLESPEY